MTEDVERTVTIPRWEYQVVWLPMLAGYVNVEEWAADYYGALNSFGCDGWELIGEMAGYGTFKRVAGLIEVRA